MNRYQSAHQKRVSRQQEKKVAKDIGGRTQAASGATRLGGGGDVRGMGYRIECKYTDSDKYVLKAVELRKLREQAFKTLEQPVMQLTFKHGGRTVGEFAIVRESGLVTGSIIAKKTSVMSLESIRKHHANDVTYAVHFEEEFDSWKVVRWQDFVRQAKAA